jgi:hypothetical protein
VTFSSRTVTSCSPAPSLVGALSALVTSCPGRWFQWGGALDSAGRGDRRAKHLHVARTPQGHRRRDEQDAAEEEGQAEFPLGGGGVPVVEQVRPRRPALRQRPKDGPDDRADGGQHLISMIS